MTRKTPVNQFIADYADRIGLRTPLEPTLDCLRRIHEAHLYNVPFENFSMHGNAERGLTREALRETIVDRRRGGICFETGRMMQWLLDACGFDYELRLGAGVSPKGPATHQIFIVTVDAERWLFDIGYGARGPRGPVRLADGEQLTHPALSTRVSLDRGAGAPAWTVSIHEHAVNAADWQDIYRFVDAPAEAADLDMAHFYTTASPHSLLNQYKVASIPTSTGRVSVRDGNLTIVADGSSTTTPVDDGAQLQELLGLHFGLSVPLQDLGLER
ncbi:arylamine N-acetyltransferase [Streptomyces sp. ISL-94]|uniref:arylamine N-acetyltransferase family protein n=1 Tax=Streptomyces sp. ISL-94 TaxID=2819190 RepID=UPI001BE7FF77|nr:arylamine N-acetyltransferase [Streptomyces sp. ISL-94]MBT2479662.1 arylamine N-acetyltransferase [Streptomyces sp. ISL-94]